MDRVTIVCANNANNCLGRCLLLADVLRDAFDVQVVGIQNPATTWSPGRSFEVPILSYAMPSALGYVPAARWLRRHASGSRVIVCKPKPTSMGLALLAGIPPSGSLLDIDDWDAGFGDAPRSRRDFLTRAPYYAKTFVHPRRLNSYLGVRAGFSALHLYPHRIVSNGWLRSRFGGQVLPHVRDVTTFDPARVESATRRRELDMEGRLWIGFVGTIRGHKGLEDLVAALAAMREPGAPGLFLAGLADGVRDPDRELVEAARDKLGASRLRTVGRFPFSELPQWLAVADVICIPSRPGATSEGQIPAKLFDALAMGKPTIISDAHDLSDLPTGCVVSFPAGDAETLRAELARLTSDEGRRRVLSAAARRVAVERFGYDSARRVLHPVVRELPEYRSGTV